MITLNVKGGNTEQIIRNLKMFPETAPKLYDQACTQAAQDLRDRTKANPDIPVDTGRMRSSIATRRVQLMAAGVYVGTNYGVYVHEGYTSRGGNDISARPFFKWTLDEGGQQAIDLIFSKVSDKLLMSL